MFNKTDFFLQVKKSIKEPTNGWHRITHENVGKVAGINHTLLQGITS